jgi:indolepyruvate ferredoxin oxidoreductase alpha subunit
VLISQAPCHLYAQRLTGKKRQARFQVVEACGDCRHCLEYFGCPAMYVKPGEAGQMLIARTSAPATLCGQWCQCIRQ